MATRQPGSQGPTGAGQRRGPETRVDVLIVTALQDELDAVLDTEVADGVVWSEERDRHSLPYFVCELRRGGGRPLVIAAAQSGVGETAAASRTVALVTELEPGCVAMCGICAGRQGAVRLGDVIVAERIYSYDHGKLIRCPEDSRSEGEFFHDIKTYNLDPQWQQIIASFCGQWEAPEPRPLSNQAQRAWVLQAVLAHEDGQGSPPLEAPGRKERCPNWTVVVDALCADGLLEIHKETLVLTENGRSCARKDRIRYPDGPPKEPPVRAHLGAIATGKTVREDAEIFDRLERLVRKTLGIDMEAAAIGSSAELAARRAIVVKAVSDFGNSEKDDVFRHFACRASAHFLFSFLQKHFEPSARATVPRYDDPATQVLAEQLGGAQERKLRLRQAGEPTVEIDREIIDLKRKLREGGVLRPGDSLGDGRYLLIERLGEGGFATVWRAHDDVDNHDVAIKVLHPNLAGDPVRRGRFLRGARQMAKLDHPAIVRVLEEHGEDGGYYYFVMKLLEGGDLHRAVLEKRFAPDQALRAVLRIGEAIEYAHGLGLVHRDIKPSNILLDKADLPYLTDFDLVAAADTTGGTRTGVLGSVVYAAPELLAQPYGADFRADVYGLGMTAVFALHGEALPPWIVGGAREFLAALPCNDAVREILQRAVAREREQRFPHIAAFCAALRSASLASSVPSSSVLSFRAPLSPQTAITWEAYSVRRRDGLIFELRPRPEDFEDRPPKNRGTVARLVHDAWSAAGVLTTAARELFLLAQAEGRRGVAALAVAVDDPLLVEARPHGVAAGHTAGPEGTVLIVMDGSGPARGWEIWVDARDAFWATHGERTRRAIEAGGAALLEVAVIGTDNFERRAKALLGLFEGARTRMQASSETLAAFVDPPARATGQIGTALTALDAWLHSRSGAALVVGPFGSGKSTLLTAWCRSRDERSDGPRPVLVELAVANPLRDAEGWLLDAASAADTTSSRAALALLVRRRMLLPCFDGIDELPLGPDDTLEARRAELFRVAGGEGKILLSAREHHFPDKNPAGADEHGDGMYRIALLSLDDDGIRTVLRHALGGDLRANEAWTRIQAEQALAALVRHPALLALTAERIDRTGDEVRIGVEEIYAAYFEQWLERTATGAHATFSREARRELAEALAGELFRTGASSCAWSDLRPAVRRQLEATLEAQHITADAALEELRDGALLVRDDDGRYGFAHAAVEAFFLARGLVAIVAARPAEALATRPLEPATVRAVAEVLRRQGEAGRSVVIRATRELLIPEPRVGNAAETAARANALRLLVGLARDAGDSAGWVPEGADLAGVDLAGEALAGVRLVRAKLCGANLSGADLSGVDFSGADLSGAQLLAAQLSGANLRAANFQGADLTFVAADGCDVSSADLTGATLRQSVWTRCMWANACLCGADVTACVLPGVPGTSGVSPRWLEATIAAGNWESIHSLAWDATGIRIASGGDHGSILIWGAASGVGLARLSGHRRQYDDELSGIRAIAWQPAGARLASVGSDRTTRIWDVALAREIHVLEDSRQAEEAGTGPAMVRPMSCQLETVFWDTAGVRIATGGEDGLRIWDAISGESLARLNRRYSWSSGDLAIRAHRLAWEPLGGRILVGGMGEWCIVNVLSAKTDGQARKPEGISSCSAVAVAWHGAVARVAMSDDQGRIWTSDLAEPLQPTPIPGRDRKKVRAMDFGGNEWLASGGEDRAARVWNLRTGREVAQLRDYRGSVYAVAFAPDGKQMAGGDGWGTVRIWDAQRRRERLLTGSVTPASSSVAWDPQGMRLASAHNDGTIRLWDAASGCILARWKAHEDQITRLAWDTPGARLASAGTDNTVRIWDTRSLEETARLVHEGAVYAVAWEPAGKRLASCGSRGSLIWDVTARNHRKLGKGTPGEPDVFGSFECHDIAWDPSLRYLADAMYSGLVRVWNIGSGEEPVRLQGHGFSFSGGATAVAWDPNGKRLASAGGDTTVRIWDIGSATQLYLLQGHAAHVTSVAWDPSGMRLASGSWDGTIRIWDASAGCQLACLEAHLDWVKQVAWSPDGKRLASAGRDGTLRIWDMASCRLLCTLEAAGSRTLVRTPGGYCLFNDGDGQGPPFALAARRPERPGSALLLPLGGLRELLHRPDKIEAALRGDLSGDGDLKRDLEPHGFASGARWDGERHVLP